ncbi:ribonuclease J [Salisediminibacterium halotolerans]|uniref:Ribonuclease J n=1 Tax=Salisediminibacterium halotolerans TaxID=517425 RepID=A0A1H9Q9T6_9BACI|nr:MULTISPECIES: ribonuclease J [Salisediminibacterium]RLJ74166.1 ribonuclease J [Actinophytocola xinjiangensis]RPE87741.1 ribonuclease J [Salisediminibacterium halotolerans]TWG35003.1 ribonuclease J [Salisediminibacterium halotolerans]SER57168.1 ribonuclease J [Salisediminibacterium haloalkalitolerans]GEL06710.1 ribonuclease J [Salisediminibacterium halotolerans]
MSNQQTENIRIYALGGLGEVGKNMYVLELDDEMIIIDAGCMIPEDDMLGVDIVIPDITYLVENKEKVKGIVLTQALEDHIGAIPYVLRELNVPVYGTKFTLALAKDLCNEVKVPGKQQFIEITSNSKIKIGTTPVNFFRTNYSVPDTLGMIVHTSQGPIVHTGDFKFDQNPVDQQTTEMGKLTEIGDKGVLALMSDSTNAETPGHSASESVVADGLKEAFHEAPEAIIVAVYSSHIHRIQQILDASKREERSVVFIGKSIERAVSIALELGYLQDPEGLIVSQDELKTKNRSDLVVVTTGSQGEPLSSLMKMAKGSHSLFKITDRDRVVMSAMPSPGNEKVVSQMIDLLSRTGADVIYGKEEKVHVSAHASQEELKLMLNVIRPQHFIPVQGEYRMQHAHRHLANSVGIDDSRIFLLEKGEVAEFTKRKGRKGNKVPSGHVLIDGLGVGDVGNIVLRDRRLLSKDGILVVVVTLNKSHKQVLSGPDIISRGFVYVRESEELIAEAEKLVSASLEQLIAQNQTEWAQMKSQIRDQLSRLLFEKTKRRPMIMPIIMEA